MRRPSGSGAAAGRPEIYFTIGYRIAGGPVVEGDLTVTAYGIGGGIRSDCPTAEELVERLSRAIAKDKPKRGKRAYAELVRRGYRGEASLAIRTERAHLYDDGDE